MKGIDIIKSTAEITLNKVKSRIFSQQVVTEETVKAIVDEIKSSGLYVIPDFFDIEIVEEMKKEVNRIFEEYDNLLWKDNIGADKRAFGANQVSEFIDKQFYYHPLIVAVREAYYELKDDSIEGCTMSNRIQAKQGNLGSGGGWHRDAVNVRQLKAITYLTDVSADHGPFQYLVGTQNKQSVLEGMLKYDLKHNHNRFTEEEIEKYMKEGKYQLQTTTATKGSLLLVDTSGIHRGMPIQKEERYALTNYYFISAKKGGKGMPKNVSDWVIPRP